MLNEERRKRISEQVARERMELLRQRAEAMRKQIEENRRIRAEAQEQGR